MQSTDVEPLAEAKLKKKNPAEAGFFRKAEANYLA